MATCSTPPSGRRTRSASWPATCTTSSPTSGTSDSAAVSRCAMRAAWELASYIGTALGLLVAIAFFAWEQRKERDNEEEEAYQLLSDAYNDFLKVVLAHPDLHLRTNEPLL